VARCGHYRVAPAGAHRCAPLRWRRGGVGSGHDDGASVDLASSEPVVGVGGDITETVYPDDDHFSLPQSSIDHAREWLASKF